MVDIRENNPHAFGDCFQCCMASILEMKREDVPHFMKIAHETGKSWTWIVNGWLHDLGLWYCELNYQYFPFCYLTHNESFWIGTGTSPRYPTQRHTL